MGNNSIFLSEPDRVNQDTLKLCEGLLRENFIKRIFRELITEYIRIRYSIPTIGKGFRWGRYIRWNLRRGILKIGHYVQIGPGTSIIYPTIIGDLTLIARDVSFVGNDHGIEEIGIPIRIAKPKIDEKQRVTKIESETWIGQGAIVFAGVTIGRGSIIAAGSVVVNDVPPYTVVGGVPARKIKKRFKSQRDEENHIRTLYN